MLLGREETRQIARWTQPVEIFQLKRAISGQLRCATLADTAEHEGFEIGEGAECNGEELPKLVVVADVGAQNEVNVSYKPSDTGAGGEVSEDVGVGLHVVNIVDRTVKHAFCFDVQDLR